MLRTSAGCLHAWKHVLVYDWIELKVSIKKATFLPPWFIDSMANLEMPEDEARNQLQICLGEATQSTGRTILAEMHSLVPPPSVLPSSQDSSSTQDNTAKEDPSSASSTGLIDVPAGSSSSGNTIDPSSGASNDSTMPLNTQSPGQSTTVPDTPEKPSSSPPAPNTTPKPTKKPITTPDGGPSSVIDSPGGDTNPDGTATNNPPHSPGSNPTTNPGTNGDGNTPTKVPGGNHDVIPPSDNNNGNSQDNEDDGNPAYDFAEPGNYKPVVVKPSYDVAELPAEDSSEVTSTDDAVQGTDGSTSADSATGDQTTASGTYVENRPTQTVMAQSSGGIALLVKATTTGWAVAAVAIAVACIL